MLYRRGLQRRPFGFDVSKRGVESARWNTACSQLPQTANCYLAIWDTQADGDVKLNNFQARFDAATAMSNSVWWTSRRSRQPARAPLHRGRDHRGHRRFFRQLSDLNALTIPSPSIVCLGNIATGGELSGTFTFTYASGVDYDITVEAIPGVSGCADTPNYADCFVQATGAGLECEVPGCVDPCACNFDGMANVSDGSCVFDCHGCIYASAANYDAAATWGDGSCEFEGCMHESASPTTTWRAANLRGLR